MADNARILDEPKGRILLVDDDEHLLRAHERILGRAGFVVATAPDGRQATQRLKGENFDTVISDITMPEMDGVALLRAVREQNLDLPVILITAQPAVATAIEAVRHGAFRYLIKPVPPEVLVREAQRAVRLYDWAKLRRAAHGHLEDDGGLAGDRAGLDANFGSALASMWMAYQPIVSCATKTVFAHEALMRSPERSLPHPGAVLRAAERLDRCEDLGQTVRRLVAATLASTSDTAGLFFVNLHVRDLLDESLYAADAPLTPHAKRIVLEITERAELDEIPDVKGCVGRLRELGFRVAIDDLGAGYAGLTSFAQLEPDVVKIDMSLVRDVHKQPIKQKLIASLAKLSKDLGLLMIAEGVETGEERDVLVSLGCDLLQGYLFARPAKPFPEVTW